VKRAAGDLRNPVSLFDQRVELVLGAPPRACPGVFDKGDRTEPGLCPPDLPGSSEWSILDAETSPGKRGRSDQITI